MNLLLKASDPNVVAQRRKSSVGVHPPPPKSVADKAAAAAVVLNRYRIEYQNDWDMPASIITSKELIKGFIDRNEPIELILPAFPFKSSNKSQKVLGKLPDEAERVSLLHLNGLCESIKEVTEHDCHLTIISDGISYNDLLDVSDSEVWTYGQTLRSMAQEMGCDHIRFSRIYELLGSDYSHYTTLTEEEYIYMVPEFRRGLERNLPDGYNVAEEISNNADVTATYRGYKKFLETERDTKLGRSRADKENAEIAKRMLNRGKAFAEAIKKRFPVSVRLSIHPSTDVNKISIALLPQDNEVPMTPWHGAAVRKVDGTITMMHAYKVLAISHEIIYKNGRPMYFQERSDLFSWNDKDLEFEYLYPTGILVRPRDPRSPKNALCTVDMQKVRQLSELCSPVVLRGFTDTRDRRAFTAKAYDLGTVLPWKSGVIQEVKDEGNPDASSNSVVSKEAMPMHYDGMFKLKTVKDEKTGQEKQVSDIPRFQYFVCQAAAPRGDGYTLFSSSSRFVRYLPQSYNIKKVSKIRWSTHSHGYFQHDLSDLPLIVPHPSLGTPCVRWLQPWPRWKTAYNSHDISIDNGSQNLISLVDSILFDRRVCLYFTWEKGDVLVSDNFAMLHTRTAFQGNCDRELWRIHVD
ncbi:Pyoverdine/dityrosine biosynthesis domain-containing protein [Trichoderma evansii]